MSVTLSEIESEQDRLVDVLSDMSGVNIVEDKGLHEENNVLVPEGHPDEGGMWVREVRVSLGSKSSSDVQLELHNHASDSEPHTIIQDTDVDFGSAATIRICCNEDA